MSAPMKTSLVSRSITAKLLVLFLLVSLIPILTIGFLSYTQSKNALRKSITDNISSMVYSRVHHIDNFMTVSLDVVTSASSLSLFRENMNSYRLGKNANQARAVLEEAMEDWRRGSNVFYRAKILDLNGIVIATTKSVFNDTGKNRSERKYFKEGLKGPYISEPFVSIDDQIPLISYSCPVLAPDSKEVIGVLVIHQALNATINKGEFFGSGLGINQITSNSEGMGKTGETYLVSQDGLILSASRFGKDIALKQSVPQPILQTLLNDSLPVTFTDYKGNVSIGKAYPIKGTNWALIGEYNYEDAFQPVSRLGKMIMIMGIIIVMLVFIAARWIARYFSSPIVKLAEIADSMATGEMNVDIQVDMNDEIGRLAGSFKAMQQSLVEKTTQAREIAEGNLNLKINLLSDHDTMGLSFKTMVENLRSQLNQIAEGINVLASSSTEITAAVTQLASASTETVTSVGQTTTTVEEVKQIAEVSHFKAREVSDSAVKAVSISKEGIKAVENTVDGMNLIRKQMELIAATVEDLSQQSLIIGEITATVNELAEQSNLLSVNASIEAAKAGEHGRGFSVVAQEMKSLANRSKEATIQVKNILKDIQKSISSTVLATEEGGKAVANGLSLTQISGETIKVLSENINDAVNAAIQIAASSQQQVEGMKQVATAMGTIKESTLQASASTKQTVLSVEELKQLGEKLSDLIHQYKFEK